MGNRRLLLSTAAALAAGPLMGMSPLVGGASALAAGVCATAAVSVYTTSGFSCSVDGVTFSDIVVTPSVAGGGSVVLTSFSPFTTTFGGATEFGLLLHYTANAPQLNSTADVSWTYAVSGNLLDDAFAEYTGSVTGSGSQNLTEVLSNGVTLNIGSNGGVTGQTFTPPVSSLTVIKDQDNFTGTAAGTASASVLGNAFSVTAVPEPSTWAMMLLGFAGLGYGGLRRRKTSVAIV